MALRSAVSVDVLRAVLRAAGVGDSAQEWEISIGKLRNLGRPQPSDVDGVVHHFVVDHPPTCENPPVAAKSSLCPNRIQSRKLSEDAGLLEDKYDFLRTQFIQQVLDIIGPVDFGHYFRFRFLAKRRSTSACSDTRPARIAAADLSIILRNFGSDSIFSRYASWSAYNAMASRTT